MTVLEHLRQVLRESIDQPLADIGLRLTESHEEYTVAHYQGRSGVYLQTVTVVRDKWWNKARGRFTIFLVVEPIGDHQEEADILDREHVEVPLADLMQRPSSDWKIWGTDDPAPLIEQLKAGMRDHGITWLRRVSNPEGYAAWKEEEGY